jgi:hypothetical protein
MDCIGSPVEKEYPGIVQNVDIIWREIFRDVVQNAGKDYSPMNNLTPHQPLLLEAIPKPFCILFV